MREPMSTSKNDLHDFSYYNNYTTMFRLQIRWRYPINDKDFPRDSTEEEKESLA